MPLFHDTDLFITPPAQKTPFDLPDATLTLFEGFFSKAEADRYYTALLQDTPWKQENSTVYGKTHLTPRLSAWYGDPLTQYTFSGTKWQPFPWTADLLAIRQKIEPAAAASFNSALLNLYRDGNDSVSWHRDNEEEFGINPVIGSVTFGETRPFQIRHKFNKEVPRREILLTHGSLLVMSGPMQHYWEHQIPKTARQVVPRINLTFRYIHPATRP